MKVVLILLIVAFSVAILSTKGSKRLLFFLSGIFFIYDCVTVSESPSITAYTTLIICFILSLKRNHELKDVWNEYPLRWQTLLIFITFFLVGIMDNRLSPASQIARPIRGICETYLCYFIGYASIRNFTEWKIAQKYILYIFLILGLYGFFTFVLQSNPWYDYVTTLYSGDVGIWSEVQSRGYRVSSFLSNPIVYGFVVGAVLVNCWAYGFKGKYAWIMILILIGNIVLSNSRTSYAAFGLSVFIIYLLYYRLNAKSFIYVFLFLMAGIVAYTNIPPFTNMVDLMIDLVKTGGEKAGGSTVELKEMQWAASIYYFKQSPWFGNGFDYFGEVIMKRGTAWVEYLAGLEGYAYSLLIEYGSVMIVAVTLFWIAALSFFWRYKNKNGRKLAIASLATTLSFLFFIFSTGTYGSVFVYISILLGMNMKCLQVVSHQKLI